MFLFITNFYSLRYNNVQTTRNYMEISIINIGNSKGLILSQTILKKYNLKDKVDIILENEQIVIKPVKEPRQGWSESFEDMAKKGDDELLIPDVFEDEEVEEW